MGLFGSRIDDTPVIVASAAEVRLNDEDPLNLSNRAKRVGRAAAWQIEAWRFYGLLGPVWYSHTWKGNAIGGLDWQVGFSDPLSGDVVPARGADGALAKGVDETYYALAQSAVDRLVGVNGSHGEWARPLGTAMSCVAEGWLVGFHVNEDGDPVPGTILTPPSTVAIDNPDAIAVAWTACSPVELDKVDGPDGNKRFTLAMSEGAEATMLPHDAVGVRIWRSHPRWADDADGAMRPLLDVCEDMYGLRLGVRGSYLSRTHSGLLLAPVEGMGIPTQTYQVTTGGQAGPGGAAGPPPNPVVTNLIAGLSTPHRDPGSASVLVPTFVTAKGEWIEKWRHIALTRDIDSQHSAVREELLRTYATGIDLPPERLLGVADLNHWTAWQVGEDSWRHVDPDARVIADGITSGYIWPDMIEALEEAAERQGTIVTDEMRDRVRDYRMTYDPTGVIVSPDRSDDADAALAAGAISLAAYRRYKHFPETDAPSDAELEQRSRLGFTTRGRPGDRPVGPGPAQSEPPSAAGPDDEARAVVRAAVTSDDTMLRYARACARLDGEFLRDTLLAVDAAVDEAVRKAQARLRSAVSRDPDTNLRARVRGVPNDQLVAIVGPRETRRILARAFADDITAPPGDDDTPGGLFAGALALLLARYSALANSASSAWRSLTTDMLGVQFTDAEVALIAANITQSTLVLEQGARAAAEAAFIGGAAAALLDIGTDGEVPAGVRIPPVVVRRAAAAAGGAPVSGGIAPMPAGWEGGLTSGPTIDDMLSGRGFVAVGMVWNYGSMSSRQSPYLPHVDLDGIEALSLDGYVGFYPGDHGGCQCTIARLYANEAGDTAEVESLDPSELP